jgi:hypothetical protein
MPPLALAVAADVPVTRGGQSRLGPDAVPSLRHPGCMTCSRTSCSAETDLAPMAFRKVQASGIGAFMQQFPSSEGSRVWYDRYARCAWLTRLARHTSSRSRCKTRAIRTDCYGMALEFDGVRYETIGDICAKHRVAEKTINRWIRSGLISKPPVVVRGVRRFRHYGDPAWLAQFEEVLHRKREGIL